MTLMSHIVGKNDEIYRPVNPDKLSGQSNVICRSSWELIFCRFADNNPNVISWSSESIGIPYIDKTKRTIEGFKKRTYYPDFLLKIKNGNNGFKIWMVEIKPYKETIQPVMGKRKSKETYMREQNTWIVNQCKWAAAKALCDRRGWIFRILTEKELIKK